jgi:hypothetical protein
MANSITAAKHYAAALDKAYKHTSLTSMLDVRPEFVREGRTAGSFLVAKQTLVGLGTYNKATGYPAGDVTLAWQEHSYSYDRGRTFSVDAMDDLETAYQAFGPLAAEFLRLHVVPEVDAVRFALLANGAGTDTFGALSSSANWVSAIDTAVQTLGDAGVPEDNMVLFTTYAGINYLKNSTVATRYNRPGENPDRRFAQWDGIDVVSVPVNRFYYDVTLNAGAATNAGGFAGKGDVLNFILMDKNAAFADLKHALPRVFSPLENQSANAWKFDYRVYHDLFVLDNKAPGIYAHSVTKIS